MNYVVLTQYGGKILGPIAKYILGPILNGIFWLLDKIHIPNIGVAIILFTIVIYILLLPLTIKQQKFSKLQAKMQPELKAIQDKYKGKKDQDSQMAMNQETQAVYSKYGVSPAGSCVQLIIQMPILFALYRVIYAIPAYVTKIGNTYRVLADKIISSDNAQFIINNTELKSVATAVKQCTSNIEQNLSNGIIDVLNKTSTSDMAVLSSHYDLGDLTYNGEKILTTAGSSAKGLLDQFNSFLGINIGNSPSETIKTAFTEHSYLLVLVAVLIPLLSAVTQWINIKLAPSASSNASGNDTADQMQSSMKMMNTFMPIFSAVMCFTLPAGLGIYWIAGAVVRSVEQVLINKHIDKMDLDAEIKKNVEKRNAKLRKAGIDPEKLTSAASLSTKSMRPTQPSRSMSEKALVNGKPVELDNGSADSTEYYNKNLDNPNSIAAKANMVKKYNEKNNR